MAVTAPALKDDPRCQPGAYISFEGKLYEAVGAKEQQNSGMAGLGRIRMTLILHVLDSGSPVDNPKARWLNESQIAASVLVRAAPVIEDAPPA